MAGKSLKHPSRDAKRRSPEDFEFKGKHHGEYLKKGQDSTLASEIYRAQCEEAKRKGGKV